MILARHQHGKRLMIAVYDAALSGKSLEEGKTVLDLSASWYQGEEAAETTILKQIASAESVHAIGEKSVAMLIKKKLVFEEDVKTIDGVPHVQLYQLS